MSITDVLILAVLIVPLLFAIVWFLRYEYRILRLKMKMKRETSPELREKYRVELEALTKKASNFSR